MATSLDVKDHNEKYVLKTSEFALKLKEYSNDMAKLIILIKNLYALPKGTHLEFPSEAGSIKLRRSDLKHFESKLNKKLMEFKKYFKYSMKKTHARPKPWLFKGIYTPVVAGAALKKFFSDPRANFGPLSPRYASLVGEGRDAEAREFLLLAKQKAQTAIADLNRAYQNYEAKVAEANSKTSDKDKKVELEKAQAEYYKDRKDYDDYRNLTFAYENSVGANGVVDETTFAQWLQSSLSDQLPLLKGNGYVLRNTITMLFFVYIHTNGLQNEDNAQYTESDDVMLDAFNNPSYLPIYFVPQYTKNEKRIMEDQPDKDKVTTYQMIQKNHPHSVWRDEKGRDHDEGFLPEKFKTFFFQNIAAVNYISKSAVSDPAIKAQLEEDEFKQAMLTEHNFVHSAEAEWGSFLKEKRGKGKKKAQ